MSQSEIAELREAAIQARRQLLDSIKPKDKETDEYKAPEPSMLDEVVEEISANAQKAPLGTAASALAAGVIAESLAGLLVEMGSSQINQMKYDAGRIIHDTFEKKATSLLDQVLATAAASLTQAYATHTHARKEYSVPEDENLVN